MKPQQQISGLVRAQIESSERVTQWAFEAGRRIKFSAGVRSVLVAGSIQLAREHQFAMVDLAKGVHYASLLALTRSVYEAYVWASWTLRIATDDRLQALSQNRLSRGLERMVKDLDGIKFVGNPMLPYMKPAIKRMDGFVHGGFEQLRYRIHAERIHPEYPDDLIIEALQISDLFAVMAILEGPAIEPDIELGDELFADVRELLHLHQGEVESADD